MSVWSRAWPICSEPVTFGGGITMVYDGAFEPASAVKYPASTHASYRRGSTSPGLYCAGNGAWAGNGVWAGGGVWAACGACAGNRAGSRVSSVRLLTSAESSGAQAVGILARHARQTPAAAAAGVMLIRTTRTSPGA